MEPQRAPRSLPLVPLLVGLVVAAALVAGALVLLRGDGDDDDSGGDDTAAPRTTPTADGEPPGEDDIDAVVAELSEFVADVRQLEFRRQVEVTLLDDEAFEAAVREEAAEDVDEIATSQRVYNALGILPRSVDLEATYLGFLGETVVGYYDPDGDALVVRGGELNEYVRSTLVHELVHALDDQHFELDRPALEEADDESGLAFSALREGNAVRVENEWTAQLTSEQRDALQAEQARLGQSMDVRGVPPVISQIVGFPYLYGPPLVGLLLDEGAERRVDDAYGEPPTTSEQVLDPAAWLEGDAEPVEVTPPPADGEVISEGVLGEWGLVLVLGPELGAVARDAASGWGGDWSVAWDDGDRTCVRATVVMDTPADLDELGSALETWANNQLDANVERAADALTFTSCG